MNKFLIGGAAAIAVAASGLAIAQTAPNAAHRRQPNMKTETRAQVQTRIQQVFARFDTNRDGFITKAEADAVQAQRADKIEKRAQRFDPAKIFGRLDANGDGKITTAEAQAAPTAKMQAKGGQPAQARATAVGGLFARSDANKDGVVTRTEFDATAGRLRARLQQAGSPRGFAGRMFDLADANKDSRVSLAEAQAAALTRFDRADLNRDGTLTQQERQQVRQQLKAQRKPS